MLVRATDGRVVTASQRPRTSVQSGRLPIILNRSPQGPITKIKRYPSSPHAGVFDTIETAGLVDRDGVRFRSRYIFKSDHIEVRWQITRSRTDVLTAEALLPSWGDGVLNAVMRSGQVIKLAGRASVRLADVRYFFIDGSEGGYVAVPRSFPPNATVHVLQPSKQSSNPRPGPSLSVRLAGGANWRDVGMALAMAPVRNGDEAAAKAPRLGAV
jgi:hypothetical protein